MEQDTHVLVVDDLEQNLVAMEALLRRPGVKVLKAQSGREALELLLAHDVAVALFDVQMPEMDGFELSELVRGSSRTRHVPIIFLTAGAVDVQRSFRGYDAGAVDFLYKPIDPHILTSKVGVFVELHRQRMELARRMEELERALQLNEMFTAVLGHDLRTPLSVVKVSAELLLMQHRDEATRNIANRLKSSAARMSRMVEQLLDVYGLKSGGIPLKPVPCDLGELIDQICAEVSVGAREGRVQVTRRGTLSAVLDRDRMLQVVANLIGNALEHGDPGHAVTVELDGDGDEHVVIRVRNRGAIPADRMESLFAPFQRAGQPQQRSGLGLGLYIVDQFVRAHGGRVELRAEADQTLAETVLPRNAQGRSDAVVPL